MAPYVIYTDSACDIPPDMLAEWGVRHESLTFRFDHLNGEFEDGGMPATEFYGAMREGHVAHTSAVNADAFRKGFAEELALGHDILYIGFSSGLSATTAQAETAAAEMRERYPDRRIVVVDSLSASAGFGLLLYLTVQEKAKGADLDQAAAFARDLVPHLCHWFTVDDLVYLKRGGRVSPTVALLGNMLSIKPVMHMDDEGHLIKVGKVRGRRNSLQALADQFAELAVDRAHGVIFISHGDCPDDVRTLSGMLKAAGGTDPQVIVNVGSVIGAHSGPGTMALFFVGQHR